MLGFQINDVNFRRIFAYVKQYIENEERFYKRSALFLLYLLLTKMLRFNCKTARIGELLIFVEVLDGKTR